MPAMATTSPSESGDDDDTKARCARLGLYGLLANWEAHAKAPWLELLLEQEECERSKRGLERRIKDARVGRFKLLADFDWGWPKEIDRQLVEEIFTLEFLKHGTNVVFIGPNGVGKTMLGQNLAHHAVLAGYTVKYTTASSLLNELARQESQVSLARRLQRVCMPQLLVIDEVGYLSYDSRHADLLFEVVSRRNQQKSTVITTNRAFKEWGEVFPNASCVVALVDRLMHQAEIVEIKGDSYRNKEAKEREARRAAERAARKTSKGSGRAQK
jgi:DNA replication protein DnaC